MQKNILRIIGLLVISGIVFSCVPATKMEAMKEKKERCEAERDDLKAENEELTTQKNEMQAELERLRKINKGLVRDTAIKGNSYRTLTVQYDKINELYNTLLENTEKLREGADAETKKALAMLEEARNDLQQKEDELRALEKRLNKEKANLNALRTELQIKEAEINKKNKQLAELQSVLNRKDSVVNVLRQKVSDALLGFEGEGLTVTKKNGKVYVSLEEKLLFASGKWAVDPKGQKALGKLAEVLEKNPDINIMIEGHTDDLEYHGSGNIEDNWDLSVKRATAIVKILLKRSDIDPQRLIASGRGEHLPVDPSDTPEARRKNRRTEIILTPKLDELFEIMNIQ
ncbi:MAG: OmpA family protein [Bacteroidota bacterium]|nr:OmpA family protein [Bacteroidota bacterium]